MPIQRPLKYSSDSKMVRGQHQSPVHLNSHQTATESLSHDLCHHPGLLLGLTGSAVTGDKGMENGTEIELQKHHLDDRISDNS